MSMQEQQAKREHTAAEQSAARAAAAPSVRSNDSSVVVPATAPGVNAQDFVKSDRVHIKYGSLFIDPYLVIHPHELAPEREPAL